MGSALAASSPSTSRRLAIATTVPTAEPSSHDARLPPWRHRYVGLVLSLPGSADQPWHADGPHLFGARAASPQLPAHALNVFVPLSHVTPELGPTQLVPTSHLLPVARAIAAGGSAPDSALAPRLRRGEVLVYDHRTVHRGTANRTGGGGAGAAGGGGGSGVTRPMLYLLYSKPYVTRRDTRTGRGEEGSPQMAPGWLLLVCRARVWPRAEGGFFVLFAFISRRSARVWWAVGGAAAKMELEIGFSFARAKTLTRDLKKSACNANGAVSPSNHAPTSTQTQRQRKRAGANPPVSSRAAGGLGGRFCERKPD